MVLIEFYTFATPNGRKVAIILEELQLSYRTHIVDIEHGDQKSPDFLQKNPNGKIPVIVDHTTNKTIFESCAILIYLTEKHGQFGHSNEDERLEIMKWLFFQAAHVGPMIGQFWHFTKFAEERVPSAISRYERECYRLFSVLNERLADRAYINDRYGVSDIATWPWIDAASEELGLALDRFPHLRKWHSSIAERPAVKRSASIGRPSSALSWHHTSSAQS
jgi:GST-like protein